MISKGKALHCMFTQHKYSKTVKRAKEGQKFQNGGRSEAGWGQGRMGLGYKYAEVLFLTVGDGYVSIHSVIL